MKKGKWIVLVIMILLMPTLVYVAFKDKETKVTDTPKITYNTYVEAKDLPGTYTKTDNDEWPSTDEYVYFADKSICTGLDGKQVDATITFDGTEVTVETLSSVNCDIYFNLK